MSDDEEMRFLSNSERYPKDVADLLSIPAAPAAERKKALKKIGKFMQAATKGRNWAKKSRHAPRGGRLATLANIYLHYVLDLWADRWRKRHGRGRVIIVPLPMI
jgi:hypothetical protein